MMPGVAVLGLACVVGGVVSSQGSKFFQSGVVIFVAVLLHNGLGYLFGYGAGKLVGMNTSKKRTIAIEVGMQNAGLATNLATTTAQFASTPESAIICAVSCTWHSISGTLLAGMFAMYDKKNNLSLLSTFFQGSLTTQKAALFQVFPTVSRQLFLIFLLFCNYFSSSFFFLFIIHCKHSCK